MPMNPNFLCCIGAELKNSTQQTTRMSQVYLYRAFEDDTLSDMLSAGFFNAAMGIIRKDDLLLLYSPNETKAKYLYARVSDVSSSGVTIEQIDIDASTISVDTTGFSNITGNNLQEVLQSIDSEFDKYVKKDGSSVMTGPLKFRAGSFVGAIAGGLGDGISIYKLKSDDSIDSEVASLTKENGFTPGTTNAQDIGSNSLKWKDLYIARVIAGVLNNGANISVPTVGGTMALVEDINNKITNCITEIPQDINLTLSNGTLTLKTGSKVYIPNGAGVFDTITIPSDKTFAATGSSTTKVFIVYYPGDGTIKSFLPQNIESGTSYSVTDGIWYDTTNNIIKRINGGSVAYSGLSFPVCVLQITSGTITSIDQVFNGFGYIGSTVFALPGVTLVKPNGRNADGSLKNIVSTITSVRTNSQVRSSTNGYLVYAPGGQSIQKSAAKTNWYYDERQNLVLHINGDASWMIWGSYTTDSNDKIISFEPKFNFHAVDYNDSEYIANCAMSSDRYVDLTLGADASTYTAPADGYLYLSKVSTALGERIGFLDTTTGPGVMSYSSASGQTLMITLPVRKGQSVQIRYSAGGTTNAFKFIYANGAK